MLCFQLCRDREKEKGKKRRENQNILVQSLLSHLGLTAKVQLKIHGHRTTLKVQFFYLLFFTILTNILGRGTMPEL